MFVNSITLIISILVDNNFGQEIVNAIYLTYILIYTITEEDCIVTVMGKTIQPLIICIGTSTC